MRKGNKKELEREKVEEQEKGKTEHREMETPRIVKRAGKRPMSEPREEYQMQNHPRTVISEKIQCLDIGEVSLPDEEGAVRTIPVVSHVSGKSVNSAKFSETSSIRSSTCTPK